MSGFTWKRQVAMVFGVEDPNQVLTTVGYLEEKSLNT
jgi:hypothetical protein